MNACVWLALSDEKLHERAMYDSLILSSGEFANNYVPC